MRRQLSPSRIMQPNKLERHILLQKNRVSWLECKNTVFYLSTMKICFIMMIYGLVHFRSLINTNKIPVTKVQQLTIRDIPVRMVKNTL